MPVPPGGVSASSGPGAWWQAHVCPLDRWPRRCFPLGTRGTGKAFLLPRLLPQIGARSPAQSSPHVSLAARLRLSAQGVGDTCLATGPLFLSGPALQLRDRFPTTRPMAPSLLLGQLAALSPDRLLGSPVTDMSLSLRLFPQAQPRFSLRQRGCPGKEAFAQQSLCISNPIFLKCIDSSYLLIFSHTHCLCLYGVCTLLFPILYCHYIIKSNNFLEKVKNSCIATGEHKVTDF